MRVLEKTLRVFVVLVLATFCLTVAKADTWDESSNGGGDAGNFPAGDFQTTDDTTVFDTITGVMDTAADPDRDSFLITITDAANFEILCVPPGGLTDETDTRLWIWDTNGMLLVANDDDPEDLDGAGLFHARIRNPSSWPGETLDNPPELANGEYILTIGGFSTDPEDVNQNDLSQINIDFDALCGLDLALSDGIFSAWEAFTTGGGAYQINLTGAEFGSVKGSMPCTNELGDVNGDSDINILDVAVFVDALTGSYVCEADINQDGSNDLLDVQPFVDLLTGG